jgi:FKBP-type peptidyl-prolyl cis-trans isomerase
MEGVSFQPRDVPVGPVAFKVGNGDMIGGLDAALIGQAPGAKLRVLVPPSQGYVDPKMEPSPPGFAAKRQIANHNREPLLFEVQMLKVLPQKQ